MAEARHKVQQCLLRSRNYKFRDVKLPDNVAMVIGRGPQTRIREKRCSRFQVQVIANYETQTATVTQLGANPSEADDRVLLLNETAELSDGSNISLLKDQFQYTLEFIMDKDWKELPSTSSGCHNSMDLSMNSESIKRETDSDASCSKKVKQTECELANDRSSSCSITSYLSDRNAIMQGMKSLNTEERWEEYDHSKLLMYTSAGIVGEKKIAAFDMDHTLITTKSGKVFPTDPHDWKIMYSEIPGKLKDLHQKGYKLVIFTNQRGISKGKTYLPDFKKKIQAVVKKLGVPMQVFVSTGSSKYRKPNTGMWDYFIKKGNLHVPVDVTSSTYVGDAAGRVENWSGKKKKDFSCADRLFALNLNLNFYTPEEFFLNQRPATFSMPAFDPRNVGKDPLAVHYLPRPHPNSIEIIDKEDIASKSQEMIILVGFPAAGKSHFAKDYLIPKGYVHINRDILGSWQKCVAECTKALTLGRSVVVDNTNPDAESRERYISCARKIGSPCRCFMFTCTIEQARHNNKFRELQNPDARHVGVNDMVMNSYKSKFQEPKLEEGYSEILKINFVPKFKDQEDELMYRKFLLEK